MGYAQPPIADLLGAPAVIVVQASLAKDGMVVCKFPKTLSVHQIVTYVRGADKVVRPVTNYINRWTQEERSFAPEQIQVFGSGGAPLDSKDLGKHLEKETWCLFSASPAAGHLRPVLKEGTLIIVLRTHPLATPATPMPAAPAQVGSPVTSSN